MEKFTLFNEIGALTLGTVQLGLNYGISNISGKPSEEKAFGILDSAREMGINCLDTAAAYGDSESVIGRYLKKRGHDVFRLITKIPKIPENMTQEEVRIFLKESFRTSLKRLNVNSVLGLLAHDSSDYFIYQKIFDDFILCLKEKGEIDNFGLSVYEERHILRGFDNCDFFQAPLNVFDNNLIKNGILKKIKDSGKFLFIRSIYLQGLFFLDSKTIINKIPEAEPYVLQLVQLTDKYSIPLQLLCICFVYHHIKNLGSIVFGVDSREQLNANVDVIKYYENISSLMELISEDILNLFNDLPEKIIKPYLW